MKIKIVTAIYCNLHGTDLGGRASRGSHYRYSLLSLLKMTDADFVCYTSDDEYEELCSFFYITHSILKEKLIFKKYNLRDFLFTEPINKIKNIEETKHSTRCVEIQYSKFIWVLNELEDYDYVFWIDAGLSHDGLIPNRYLSKQNGGMSVYFESSLFNNSFLKNLVSFSDDSIVLFAKENKQNYWSGTVPSKYYKNYCYDYHIIGGCFGGKTNLLKDYCNIFIENTLNLLNNEKLIYYEENIMSLIYYNNQNLFKLQNFDTWWHENDPHYLSQLGIEYFNTRKSFYRILEDLNDITDLNRHGENVMINLSIDDNTTKHFYYQINDENWFDYDDVYSYVVSIAKNDSHFVEVGSWKGKSACFMSVEIINSKKNIRFDCVDTWEYVPTSCEISEDKFNNLFNIFLTNIHPVKDHINIVKMLSSDASSCYDDNSLDFVYLDAGHEYHNIYKDITLWYPKIKYGGLIGGHNYHYGCGVFDAVNDFFGKNNIKLMRSSWIYEKNK